ncbi:MAG: site-2 protease family protein [Ignisphaera sp.]
MDDSQIILTIFVIFTAVTTILSVYARDKHIFILNKLKIQFTIGGILIFVGKGHRAFNPKPLNKGFSYGLMSSVFIGALLFYTMLLPKIIKFISDFISYVLGTTTSTPTPVVVPIPLLFKSSGILPYPLPYLLVSIVIAVILHELAHAIVALKEGVSIKSWGVGLVLLIPIAFVELNDSELDMVQTKSKLNIISAGVFANALASAILIITAITASYIVTQIYGAPIQVASIAGVDCSICNTSLCPAKVSGIEPNMVIESVNNTRIESLEHLLATLRNTSLGSNMSIRICNYSGVCRDITLRLTAHRKDLPSTPCIDVVFTTVTAFMRDSRIYIAKWFEELMLLMDSMITINFSLFVLNAIPLFITDGSLFLKYLLRESKNMNKFIALNIIDAINALVIILAIVVSSYILFNLR